MQCTLLPVVLGGGVLALLAAGCSTASYKRTADKNAYGNIERVEQQLFGHTNAFTIDTPYSSRKPATIFPEELIEDRLRTNSRTLSLDEAIDVAVNNSREYQTQKETLFKTALTLSDVRNAAGPTVTPIAGATFEGDRDTDGHESSSSTVDSRLVFTQLFKTGGRMTVDLLNSIMFYFSGRPEVSFSRISGSIVQPLWRGFGANNDEVEAVTQAERNMVYAVRTFSQFQNSFALNVANDYFSILQQKDTIRSTYTNYLRRVSSTERLEARADRESLNNVQQARQAELSARNSYVNAVARYLTSLDDFKITLGLPITEKLALEDSVLAEVGRNGLVPVVLNTTTAYNLATQKQMLILNAIDQFEDSKRKVRIAADKLKPGLNLIAASSLQSEGTDSTKFDTDKYEAGFGLRLDLPLDRVPLANRYRAALITFQSDLRAFTRRLDDLKNSIDRGMRTLEQRRQNYETEKAALVLASIRVEYTTMSQEAGRLEVRDLNDALDSYVTSQIAVTAALLSYQQARLQLMLDIGALETAQPKFWLKDQLVGFLPADAPIPPARRMIQGEKVPPPDYFFDNLQ
ncbi:MAG: TolC family protein [Acidobacteriia bacterium]|nr:TolC family protein [Terriglobia bacterium]